MSQCATLYRITKEDFARVTEQPGNADVPDTKALYETFAGTHEGLRFVLSKLGDSELVEQIFYPRTFIGNEVDFKNMEEEDIESLGRRVYYLNPGLITEIEWLLNKIGADDFKSCFNADELNKENIYPWQWNNSKERNIAYNEKHIIEDFEKLKSLFKISKTDGDYILSYVG